MMYVVDVNVRVFYKRAKIFAFYFFLKDMIICRLDSSVGRAWD